MLFRSAPRAAALRALGEGLDDGRLVGVLLLVDVHRQPLPQVLPAAALLVLRPSDRLAVGAAERRQRRGDCALPVAVVRLGACGTRTGDRRHPRTPGEEIGEGAFAAFEFKAACLSLAFRSSLPRKDVEGATRKVKGVVHGNPGGGNGNPLPFSCPGNPMDRGAWRAADHRLGKPSRRTWRLNSQFRRSSSLSGSVAVG